MEAPTIDQEAIDMILRLNQGHKCTFLMPTKFICAENAKAAALISKFVSDMSGSKENWKSFFSNSFSEAIQATIKCMRHHAYSQKSKGRAICLYGGTEPNLLDIFDIWPCHNLYPKIHHIVDIKEVQNRIDEFCGVIFLNGYQDVTTLNKITNDKLFAAYVPDPLVYPPTSGTEPLSHFDIFIFGSEISMSQVPVGITCMSEKAYDPWNKFSTSFIHSSTYSGNRLSSALICQALSGEKYGGAFTDNHHINSSDLFSRFINPSLAELYKLAGFDKDPTYAQGSTLRYASGREVIDATSGGGAAVRGHCPEISESLLAIQNRNVHQDLEDLLSKKTGLPHIISTVSGTSAVDIALKCAQLSREGAIITFSQNYSGKTLLPMSVTDDRNNKEIFGPLCPHSIVIDLNSENPAQSLLEIQQNHKISVIWFEYIQGASASELPLSLIQTIREIKDRTGCYIGVDEILSGGYRTGKFLSCDGVITPDIITLSKSLSDGTYPYACTLISDKLHTSLTKLSPAFLEHIKNRYSGSAGEMIAYNSTLSMLQQEPQMIENIQTCQNILAEALDTIKSSSKWLEDFTQKGMLTVLKYNCETNIKNPVSRSLNEPATVLAFTKRLFENGVLPFFDRLIPALTLTPQEATFIADALKKTFLTEVEMIDDEISFMRERLLKIELVNSQEI